MKQFRMLKSYAQKNNYASRHLVTIAVRRIFSTTKNSLFFSTTITQLTLCPSRNVDLGKDMRIIEIFLAECKQKM